MDYSQAEKKVVNVATLSLVIPKIRMAVNSILYNLPWKLIKQHTYVVAFSKA